MSSDEDLIITPIPSLVSLLIRAEQQKGQPLTQEEVENIRDTCACIALPPDAARAVTEKRGYVDVDPEDVWNQWQRVRLEM